MKGTQWSGDGSDGSLDPRPNTKAKAAPVCCSCGYVVYKRAVAAENGVFCISCWEAVKHRRAEQEARDRLEAEQDAEVLR